MNNSVTIPLGMACVTFLCALIYIFHKTQFGPLIAKSLVTFAEHGQKQGLNYLIGACLVLGACLTSFYDNFMPVDIATAKAYGWWQMLALFSKSLSAAPAALVGFLLRSPLTPKVDVTTVKTTESVALPTPLP